VRLIHLSRFAQFLPPAVKSHLLGPWNGLLGWEQSLYERRLYARFVKPGDLVFDIGANRGGKSAAFLSLGAKVVAVEPNPNCVAMLSKRFVREIDAGRLILLPVAIGRSAGRVQLRQFALNGGNASASNIFTAALEQEFGAPSAVFNVEMIAGASLFERFGVPVFIKIDVEGMDAEVLSTVPHRPRMMSFEFNLSPHLLPMNVACLVEVTRLGFTEANFTEAAGTRLLLREWVTLDRVLEEICRAARGRALWGDVFVR
jgi:FkbM family methyltransferase